MENKIKQAVSLRHKANLEILGKIQEAVERYPCLRFGQILANLKVIDYERDYINDVCTPKDPYHEESVETLSRIKKF